MISRFFSDYSLKRDLTNENQSEKRQNGKLKFSKDACAAMIAMSKDQPECKEKMEKAIAKSKDADKALVQTIQVRNHMLFCYIKKIFSFLIEINQRFAPATEYPVIQVKRQSLFNQNAILK